jgi:hypothetical protein
MISTWWLTSFRISEVRSRPVQPVDRDRLVDKIGVPPRYQKGRRGKIPCVPIVRNLTLALTAYRSRLQRRLSGVPTDLSWSSGKKRTPPPGPAPRTPPAKTSTKPSPPPASATTAASVARCSARRGQSPCSKNRGSASAYLRIHYITVRWPCPRPPSRSLRPRWRRRFAAATSRVALACAPCERRHWGRPLPFPPPTAATAHLSGVVSYNK